MLMTGSFSEAISALSQFYGLAMTCRPASLGGYVDKNFAENKYQSIQSIYLKVYSAGISFMDC